MDGPVTTRGRKLTPSEKQEADALLTALTMAERHKHWGMMTSILTFIRDAGGKLLYLEPGNYALELPAEGPQ